MHEAGIATQLLAIVLDRARAAGADRVTDVHLEIGELSDVSLEALEHYWPEVSRSTAAADARLHATPAADPLACRVIAIDVPEDR